MKFKLRARLLHFLPRFITYSRTAAVFNWFLKLSSISEKLSPQFCETYKIAPDLAKEYEYSILKKVAKSTCILKCDIIIGRIMNARMILAKNMYYGKFLLILVPDQAHFLLSFKMSSWIMYWVQKLINSSSLSLAFVCVFRVLARVIQVLIFFLEFEFLENPKHWAQV